jgi:16S rRNA processing protein RimM
MTSMQRVVGRIGRAIGLKGEVSVEVRTDSPGERFVPGVVLATDPVDAGPLTLRSARDHSGVLVLAFERVDTREGADALRGLLLTVDAPASDEPDAWYESELVGLTAWHVDGHELGEVVRLDTGAAQDLLVVRTPGRGEVLVPFVTAIVPEVDLTGRRVVVDPPGGLFEDLQDPDSEPGIEPGSEPGIEPGSEPDSAADGSDDRPR